MSQPSSVPPGHKQGSGSESGASQTRTSAHIACLCFQLEDEFAMPHIQALFTHFYYDNFVSSVLFWLYSLVSFKQHNCKYVKEETMNYISSKFPSKMIFCGSLNL